jgi:aminoglycoside phosphotransferase (APT) family kinase protein
MESVHHVLAAAARQGLQLRSEQTDFDKMGLDFLVVHAHDEADRAWILRTPRRPDVVASAAIEARILRGVAPHLPVPVPDWQVHTPELIAYPRLAGQPAVTVEASGPVWHVIDPRAPSPRFIGSMARFYAALQAVDRIPGVPVDDVHELRHGLARAAEATRAVLEPPEHLWARWQRWLADDSYWPAHVALAHGDLHPGHMLLSPDGTLCGVLDWTEARFTDPALDLAMFHGCFGRTVLDEMLAAFAAAGGHTWPRLAEHAVEWWSFLPVRGAEWALRASNPDVIAFARAQLQV